jgi:hypothetical protein
MNSFSEKNSLAWTSWPVRQRPRSLLLVIPVCGAALASVFFLTKEASWVGIGALLLAIGLREYFLPAHYILDSEGMTIRYLLWSRRQSWGRVKRMVPQKTGVFLSPFPGPSRLEAFRGMFLRYDANKEKVLEAVRWHLTQSGCK